MKIVHCFGLTFDVLILPVDILLLKFLHGTQWNVKVDPWKRIFVLETVVFRFHVSSDQNPGYIGDYTSQLYRDYNEP